MNAGSGSSDRTARSFSALQRAEIAEIDTIRVDRSALTIRGFSALQRAEIAEIDNPRLRCYSLQRVSVLFNEPKLLKFGNIRNPRCFGKSFSALQRAEIAEIREEALDAVQSLLFQCSSTSRNC